MTRGFRLYKVRIVRGAHGSKPREMSELGLDGKTHASKHIMRLIETLEGFGTLTTTPTIEPSGDDELEPIGFYESRDPVRGDPGIQWLESTRTGKRRIDFEVLYGHVGRYGQLVGATKGDVEDIGKKTAANRFRGTIFLPKEGIVGVLALETIDNAHPYLMVKSWLARAAFVAKLEDKAIVEAKYADTDDEGEGDDLDLADSIWKPSMKPITDYNRLVELLTTSDAAEVHFVRRRRTKSGKFRKDPMRLTVWTAEAAKRADIAGIVRSTFETEGTKDIPGAVIELQNSVVGNVSGIEFDDVAIVASGNGPKKTIYLSSLEKALTYNIPGNKRPGKAKWDRHIKEEINRLQTLDESELDLDL